MNSQDKNEIVNAIAAQMILFAALMRSLHKNGFIDCRVVLEDMQIQCDKIKDLERRTITSNTIDTLLGALGEFATKSKAAGEAPAPPKNL